MVSTILKPTQVSVDDLPPSLKVVVDLIGINATLALVSHHGGIRVYVPQRIHSEHPLAKQIGLRGARALSMSYPGELLSVPRAAKALRAARNTEIRKNYNAGKSAAKLAQQFSLTERQVLTILKNTDVQHHAQRILL